MSRDTALANLEDAVEEAAAGALAADHAFRRRDNAIHDALQAGVPVPVIVATTGLSRARIYQIRDSTR